MIRFERDKAGRCRQLRWCAILEIGLMTIRRQPIRRDSVFGSFSHLTLRALALYQLVHEAMCEWLLAAHCMLWSD